MWTQECFRGIETFQAPRRCSGRKKRASHRTPNHARDELKGGLAGGAWWGSARKYRLLRGENSFAAAYSDGG